MSYFETIILALIINWEGGFTLCLTIICFGAGCHFDANSLEVGPLCHFDDGDDDDNDFDEDDNFCRRFFID